MKYLIWDFNGTIIDDIDVCVACENEVIKKYMPGRAPLTKEEYLRIFSFPVKDYYKKMGFTFEKNDYEEIGKFWFEQYVSKEQEITVFPGVIELMVKAREMGIKNVILSASRSDELHKQLKQFNLNQYLDEVIGANDIYAFSKTANGIKFIEGKDPKECLYLGDTVHDLETANAMGVKCMLIAKGHTSKEDLLKAHDLVFDDIREVKLCE